MPDSTPPIYWEPNRITPVQRWTVPTAAIGLWRGARGLCPACGRAAAFQGYLRVVDHCAHCDAPLGSLRADDAPPYFTLLIVGHLLIPALYFMETAWHPELWVLAAVFLPLSAVFTMALLRPVKGATLGLMLRLGMAKAGGE